MARHICAWTKAWVSRLPTVLGFGTYDKRKHPRVGILLDGLRAHGCDIEEINAPLDLSTAQRVEILKKPWKLFGFALRILRLWKGLVTEAHKWIRENGAPDAVVVGYMGHFDVLLARHVFRGTPIILDHLIFAADTAKDRGAQGIKVRALSILDKKAINAADLILLDTDEHQAMLPAERIKDSLVIPVGASLEWYQAGKSARGRTGDVIFFGLFTPLQGTPVIANAIKELFHRGRKMRITFVGTGQDYPEVRSLLNEVDGVTFLDWVEPENLPWTVAEHAISLGIFSTTPKGLRVVPNKVYQSLAAGCAVITSDTPPQRRMLGDGVIYVRPGDSAALADMIDALLSDEGTLRASRDKATRASASFTPSEIVTPLYARLMDVKGVVPTN